MAASEAPARTELHHEAMRRLPLPNGYPANAPPTHDLHANDSRLTRAKRNGTERAKGSDNTRMGKCLWEACLGCIEPGQVQKLVRAQP